MTEFAPSHCCIRLVKLNEGCKTTAYKPKILTEVNGKPKIVESNERYFTIGYGHSGPDVQRHQIITQDQAELLLKQDLGKFAKQLNAICVSDGVELNQNQFDALISFAYNTGLGALAASTLWKKLIAKDYAGAAAQFDRWIYASGVKSNALIERRRRERELFETSAE